MRPRYRPCRRYCVNIAATRASGSDAPAVVVPVEPGCRMPQARYDRMIPAKRDLQGRGPSRILFANTNGSYYYRFSLRSAHADRFRRIRFDPLQLWPWLPLAMGRAGRAIRCRRTREHWAGRCQAGVWLEQGRRRPGGRRRWAMARSITSRWKSPSHRACDGSVSPSASLRARAAASNGFLASRDRFVRRLKYSMAMSMRWDSSAHVQSLARSCELGFCRRAAASSECWRNGLVKGARAAQRIPGALVSICPSRKPFMAPSSYGAENSSPDRAVGLRYELRA